MKVLLFDIDQTLIHTGGAGLRALDRACHSLYGLRHAMEGISPHGKTDPAIARKILRVKLGLDAPENGEIASILESYVHFLKDEVQSSANYRLLPGIVPLLDELRQRSDVMLGLATGNIEVGARIKLDRADLNPYFPFGGFGSDSENRWELVQKAASQAADIMGGNISPGHVFVIGDTPLDVEAGRRAGFETIGVATGHYSVEQLLAAGATAAVDDLDHGRDHFLRSTLIE